MPELDDLRLNEPEPAPQFQQPRGPGLLVPALIVAAIIGIGLGVLLWPRQAPPPAQQAAAPPAPESYPVSAPASKAVEGENIPLPPLNDTDPIVRQLVSQVSSHPRVASWLTTDGLLRNFAVVVTNIADGGTPIKALRSQRPAEPFSVRTTDQGTTVIEPASFARYDSYADAVAGLDAQGTARLYETLKPRIAEAYTELGNPSGDIDAALKRAFALLLATPQVNGDIQVVRTSVSWKFADPQLEALKPAQKQLLRMGPRNQRIIQDKLREIAPYLGF
jgi:hypothetical protein